MASQDTDSLTRALRLLQRDFAVFGVARLDFEHGLEDSVAASTPWEDITTARRGWPKARGTGWLTQPAPCTGSPTFFARARMIPDSMPPGRIPPPVGRRRSRREITRLAEITRAEPEIGGGGRHPHLSSDRIYGVPAAEREIRFKVLQTDSLKSGRLYDVARTLAEADVIALAGGRNTFVVRHLRERLVLCCHRRRCQSKNGRSEPERDAARATLRGSLPPVEAGLKLMTKSDDTKPHRIALPQ
jgi:hypothetical protein